MCRVAARVALIAVGVSGGGLHATWGAALCLLSAIVYAGGVVAQRPALRQSSALSVTWLACTVGAVACLPWAPGLVTQLGHTSARTVGWTVYLGVGPLAIGFGTWSFALARAASAGRLGVSTYLVPPLVVVISWIALSQTPPVLALPGGILCLAGVAVSRRRAAPRSPARSATGELAEPVRPGVDELADPVPGVRPGVDELADPVPGVSSVARSS